MAEKQRNNALSKALELEAQNKELQEILSDLLLNATAKAPLHFTFGRGRRRNISLARQST